MMKKLLAALLLTAMLAGCSSSPAITTEAPTDPTTESTTETTDATTAATEALPEAVVNGIPGYGNNDVSARSHYTVNVAAPDDENMTAVIAVNANNEPVFENRHLQVSFWTEYLNFMNTYGGYASLLGIDTSAPLNSQNYEEGKTWEMYFLEFAVQGLGRNYALAQFAYANGYELSAEDQATIDDITKTEGSFADEYTMQGYSDADTYIQFYFGDGTDAKSYQDYYRMYFAAADVYNSKQQELQETLTEDAILAYYNENKESFESQGLKQVNNVNVRHILISPEGEETEWTDESWAAAEKQAQEIYDEWLTEQTEEHFTALAVDKTMDPGSAESGGLYTDVAPGDMVAEFNDWCFDESRQPGDHGIVKTTYGYHIMYFVGQAESRAWYDAAAEQLVYEQLQSFVTECETAYPLSFDYTLIRIFDVATANSVQPAG